MRLYINIDHVATLRQARRTDEPDPVAAARLCEEAGADGITVHLREDRRHIQDADVIALAGSVRTVLNFELATSERSCWPWPAASAPSRPPWCPSGARRSPPRAASTSRRDTGRLRDAISAAVRRGNPGQPLHRSLRPVLDAAAALGVAAVELHTGRYAHSWRPGR